MRPSRALLLILSLTPCLGFSQPGSLQKEINEQVWEPFIDAFNARDDAGLKAIYSMDFIRVRRDSDQIYGYEEYFEPEPDSLKERWAVWQRNIELRFTQRIASEDEAFEVGYYKTTSTHSTTGEKRTSYGKFYVLLRKENGQWKLLLDADGHEGTDEASFQSAEPMH